MDHKRSVLSVLSCVLLCGIVLPSVAKGGEDWPMWRYDPARSAASPADLPAELHLQWIREYPPLTPTWEDTVNRDRMTFDRVYEPVVAGSTMFVGSNRSDRLTALDTRTGEEKWRFYADGPVRLPPVAWKDKVYFVSDDGYLYAVDAAGGSLVWKVRGGPRARRVLGNGRLISTWCARGGPVIADGTIYFSAGIWPFMGVFIHALDAETGKRVWTNDAQSSRYMNQPHQAPSFAGVAPQGAFAAIGDKLLVPGGRSVPACLDRATGKLLYYHLASMKREGGSHVSAMGKFYFNHRGINTYFYDLEKGRRYAIRDEEAGKWDPKWGTTTYPVLDNDICYLSGNPVVAYDLTTLKKVYYNEQVRNRQTRKMETKRRQAWGLKRLWEFPVDGTGAMIKAGGRLYVGGEGTVSAMEVRGKDAPKLAWTKRIEGTAGRIIAADGKLFVVTLEGRIYAFGPDRVKAEVHAAKAVEATPSDEAAKLAEDILKTTGVRAGYALAFGIKTGKLAEQLVRQSDLYVIAVCPDAGKVAGIRRRLDEAGLYGTRISLHVGDPTTFRAPPYLASLVVFEDPATVGLEPGGEFLRTIYESMRPYGGVACLPAANDDQRAALSAAIGKADLPGAALVRSDRYVLLRREGRLPGSADWTHQYGDVANTSKSDDKLVKAPLGVLWFGGNTHEDVLPRHGHGPPEQVVGGRLFIEGVNMLSARDVYTGRVLWKREFDDLGTFDVYYDKSYNDNPLDVTYNQTHIPGANSRGTNYVAAPDKVYILVGGDCLVLDPATGKTLQTISLPPGADGKKPEWGYIGIYEDLLIAGSAFVRFSERYGVKISSRENHDFASSHELIVMDRHTGEVRWRKPAKYAFRHNAVAAGAGKLFCIDALPKTALAAIRRRGESIEHAPVLFALDVRTGDELWRKTKDVFGTWLGYSREHDVLLQSGRGSSDMVDGESIERMMAYRAARGTVLWDKPIRHFGPCMLHGETIYLNAFRSVGSAVSLLTGDEKLREHPLTGEEVPWRYYRAYGCNSVTAGEYLLTFRSGAAGYYDLRSGTGTGTLGGFKSGCTSNLIAADGVLNAPDYTRTCGCAYQNQTSLALVHDPEVEVWTFDKLARSEAPVRRVGINLGAPGDRRAAEGGTLWLDHPSVGGPSPDVPVRVEGKDLAWFRNHSSRIESGPLRWVGASGVEGIASVTVTLAGGKPASAPVRSGSYTVKLVFAEPHEIGPQRRIFDVAIQGSTLLKDFDVAREAGGARRTIVREFSGVKASGEKGELTVAFTPKTGASLLCGIEIVEVSKSR